MCRPNTGIQHLAAYHHQQKQQQHAPPQQQQRSNRVNRANTWWKKSMAIRTVAHVDGQVETLMSNCRFLKQQHDTNEEESSSSSSTSNVATFRRREIEIGDFLGHGAFSEVYAVTGFDTDDDDEHDTDTNSSLRQHLQQTAINDVTGESRYVIKHLRSDLINNRNKFHSAAADLVLEANFLSCIDHPNIIKLHAIATGGTSSFGDGKNDGYFLVLDCLDDTLSHRIEQWTTEEQTKNPSKRNRSSMLVLDRHYAEKINYAYQIAEALNYLHQHDIMYRDLKPANIGIQNDGTVKLFDFGLCRELPEEISVNNNTDKVFNMSGCGTRRYMAPEVALNQPYNVKADVYSFSMVVYELISLKKPYELYNSELHQLLVCENGQRPTLNVNWPKQIQDLLRNTWSSTPSNRLSMEQVCSILQRMIGHNNGGFNHNSCTTTKPKMSMNTTPSSPISLLGLLNTRNTIVNFVEKFKTTIVDMTSTTCLSISMDDNDETSSPTTVEATNE